MWLLLYTLLFAAASASGQRFGNEYYQRQNDHYALGYHGPHGPPYYLEQGQYGPHPLGHTYQRSQLPTCPRPHYGNGRGRSCYSQCDERRPCYGMSRICCHNGCGTSCVTEAYHGPLSMEMFRTSVHEASAYRNHHMPMSHNPAVYGVLAYHPPNSIDRDAALKAQILTRASVKMAVYDDIDGAHNYTYQETYYRLQAAGVHPQHLLDFIAKGEMLPGEDCMVQVLDCNPAAKFRTLDGRCNNLNYPQWGSTHSTFSRYLPPAYEDQVDIPRSNGVGGEPLPYPRSVVLACHDVEEVESPNLSHMVMQWGQFLDHDVTLTPEGMDPSLPEGMTIDCEKCDSGMENDICFPIHVPPNDPKFDTPCLDFKRSMAGQMCYGPRQQFNAITSFIDASNVYGSDINKAAILRQGSYGHMRIGEKGMMMTKETHEACPLEEEERKHCFFAGDVRSNVQAALSSIHTLWVHQHNKIAHSLSQLNPHWGDGRLYQEARKIVGAQNQWISYNEWIPKILGPGAVRHYGLDTRYGQRYNPYCDATIANVFATAAFRFGHSLIRSFFDKTDGTNFTLNHNFFHPQLFHEGIGKAMHLMQGLCKQPAGNPDMKIIIEMSHHLFETKDLTMAHDVVSLNIQRARDHGLPGWHAYRKVFGLSVPNDFDHAVYLGIFDAETAKKFQTVYNDIRDIDIFPGLLGELPAYGAVLGPLWVSIMGDNFRRLKYCDRYWFQWEEGPQAFNHRQIAAIMDTTLTKVICDHVQEETFIKLDAFAVPTHYDRRQIRCLPYQRRMVSIDLSAWREYPAYQDPYINAYHDEPIAAAPEEEVEEILADDGDAEEAETPIEEPHLRVKRDDTPSNGHPGYSDPYRRSSRHRGQRRGYGGYNGYPQSYSHEEPGNIITRQIPPRCYTIPDPNLVFALSWY